MCDRPFFIKYATDNILAIIKNQQYVRTYNVKKRHLYQLPIKIIKNLKKDVLDLLTRLGFQQLQLKFHADCWGNLHHIPIVKQDIFFSMLLLVSNQPLFCVSRQLFCYIYVILHLLICPILNMDSNLVYFIFFYTCIIQSSHYSSCTGFASI